MIDYNLDELERLEKAATPGEWRAEYDDLTEEWFAIPSAVCGYGLNHANDVKFAAAARNALPAMIRDLRELELRRKGEWICPRCFLRQGDQHPKGDF